MDYKKLSLFILVFLLALAPVLAVNLGTSKNANLQELYLGYPKVTLNNGFLGLVDLPDWLGGGEIASYQIEKHTEKCLFDCSSEQLININQDMPLVDDLVFKDEAGKTLNIPYQLYLVEQVTKERQVIDKDLSTSICTMSNNKNSTIDSNNCVLSKIVYKTEEYQEEVKTPYTIGEIMPSGEYHLLLNAQVPIGKKVDYIYTANGVEMSEMAWFDSNPFYTDNFVSNDGNWYGNTTGAYFIFNSSGLTQHFVVGQNLDGLFLARNITGLNDTVYRMDIIFTKGSGTYTQSVSFFGNISKYFASDNRNTRMNKDNFL